MLALMPHLSPQMLDIFFVHNKNFDCPYTEFGGWKGLSHGGFLPTGETAVFLLAGDRVERRLEVVRLFREEHWFHMYHVVGLEGAGNGEPFLSGQLRISEDFYPERHIADTGSILDQLSGKEQYTLCQISLLNKGRDTVQTRCV